MTHCEHTYIELGYRLERSRDPQSVVSKIRQLLLTERDHHEARRLIEAGRREARLLKEKT